MKKQYVIIVAAAAVLAFLSAFIFNACKKVDFDPVTKSYIKDIYFIDTNSRTIYFKIHSLNPKFSHPDYGICYSSSNAEPSINDEKFSFGAITDTLTKGITVENLKPNTIYYFRSFVMDDENAKYGDVISLNTSFGTEFFTDSRDGNIYKTVKIGSQTWMAENLKYLPSVVRPGRGSETKSFYYVHGYNGTNVSSAKATENYKTYGVLYNWPAAKQSCPSGWHLPSDSEWEQMENYLADNGYNYDGTTGGGRDKIAKALASKSGWSSSSSTGSVGNTDYSSYRNKSGFTALPGGSRDSSGSFSTLGDSGLWWSATEDGSSGAWRRSLFYDSSYVLRYSSNKAYGYSVRCVRD